MTYMLICWFQVMLRKNKNIRTTNDSVAPTFPPSFFNKMTLIGERGKIFLLLSLLWCAYVVIGIFVFTAVEGNVQRTYLEQEEGRNTSGVDDDYYDRRWGYGDSFWFVIVLLTTIGKNTDVSAFFCC